MFSKLKPRLTSSRTREQCLPFYPFHKMSPTHLTPIVRKYLVFGPIFVYVLHVWMCCVLPFPSWFPSLSSSSNSQQDWVYWMPQSESTTPDLWCHSSSIWGPCVCRQTSIRLELPLCQTAWDESRPWLPSPCTVSVEPSCCCTGLVVLMLGYLCCIR